MNVTEAIQQRHSVRQFLDKPVAQHQIEHILDVAKHAPSGANTQPWQVAVLTGQTKTAITEALSAAFDQGVTSQPDYQYYPQAWKAPYLDRRRACGLQLYQSLNIERSDKAAQKAQWAANYRGFDAPAILLVYMDNLMQTGSFLDCGMFVQSLMLAAMEQGLGTCPQAALAEYPQVIKPLLGLPDDTILLCGLALGYEDITAPVNQYRTAREAVENFTRFYN